MQMQAHFNVSIGKIRIALAFYKLLLADILIYTFKKHDFLLQYK